MDTLKIKIAIASAPQFHSSSHQYCRKVEMYECLTQEGNSLKFIFVLLIEGTFTIRSLHAKMKQQKRYAYYEDLF